MSIKSREDINNDLDSTIASGGTAITGDELNAELKKITESYHNKLSDPTPVDETSEQTISGQKTFGSSIKATGGIEGNGTTLDIDTSGTTINIGGINSVVNIPGSLVNSALGGAVESITHADLKLKLDNSELVAGKIYLINDFQTKHQIPDTTDIHTEVVEPIIVTAVSTAKIAVLALSTVYENDIIHYDITNDICEDGTTPRTGFITRRIDTENVLETPYDFRGVKYRRWKVEGYEFYPTSGTTSAYTVASIENAVIVSTDKYFESMIQFHDTNNLLNATLSISKDGNTVVKNMVNVDGGSLTEGALDSVTNDEGKALVYYSPNYDAYVVHNIINESGLTGYLSYSTHQYYGHGLNSGVKQNLNISDTDYIDVYTFNNRKDPINQKIRLDYESTGRLSNIYVIGESNNNYGQNSNEIEYCENSTFNGHFWKNKFSFAKNSLFVDCNHITGREVHCSILYNILGLHIEVGVYWTYFVVTAASRDNRVGRTFVATIRITEAVSHPFTNDSGKSYLGPNISASYLNLRQAHFSQILGKLDEASSDFIYLGQRYAKPKVITRDFLATHITPEDVNGEFVTDNILFKGSVATYKEAPTIDSNLQIVHKSWVEDYVKSNSGLGIPPVSLVVGEPWLDTITNQVKIKTGTEVAYYLDQGIAHDFTTTVDGSNRIDTKTYPALSLTLNYTYNGVSIYPETIDDGTYKVDFTYDANGNVLTKTYGLI